MNEIRFGYLQEPIAIKWSEGEIRPLESITDIAGSMELNTNAYGDWFYPPLQPALPDLKVGKTAPLIATGFCLPATHVFLVKNRTVENDYANFIIATFGLLKGRRLQREGWEHLYKTPLASKLCDFFASDSEVEIALDCVSRVWLSYSDIEIRNLIYSALHWHMFAQLYQHEFERFNAQYMALDACYALARKTLVSFPKTVHSQRANALCAQLDVPPPAWAVIPDGQKECALSKRRNSLIHEAMYGNQAIGFAYPTEHQSMELELTGLVARILLRLLRIDNEYTRSKCTTRATINFGICVPT